MAAPSVRGARPALKEPVSIHGKLPLLLRWTDFYRDGERLGSLTHIWTTTAQWKRMEESRDPKWKVRIVGFLVIAYRIVI